MSLPRKKRVPSKSLEEQIEAKQNIKEKKDEEDAEDERKELSSTTVSGNSGTELSTENHKLTPQNKTECELAKKELLVAILSTEIENLPDLISNVLQYTNGNLNYRDGKKEETLIHKCVNQKVDFRVITCLFEKGARVDARDIYKASPLHYAASIGDNEMTKFLLRSSANPMLKDRYNQAPLHKAAIGNHPEVIETLLSNYALINHKDIQGLSALHVAAQNENYEAVDCLIHKGADVLLLSYEDLRPVDYIPKQIVKRKIIYSQNGKKIYKLLKRKGGCKDVRAKKSSSGQFGNGRRSHSIGHRPSRSLSHDVDPFTDENVSCDVEEVYLDSSDEEDKTAKECEEALQKIISAPRVDKNGFLKKNTDADSEPMAKKKQVKKMAAKEEKRTLKWLSWLSDWDNSFESKRPKVKFFYGEDTSSFTFLNGMQTRKLHFTALQLLSFL